MQPTPESRRVVSAMKGDFIYSGVNGTQTRQSEELTVQGSRARRCGHMAYFGPGSGRTLYKSIGLPGLAYTTQFVSQASLREARNSYMHRAERCCRV
jgi:hypothetical protein